MSEIYCMVCDGSPCLCECSQCQGMGAVEIALNEWMVCEKCAGAGFPAGALDELTRMGKLL